MEKKRKQKIEERLSGEIDKKITRTERAREKGDRSVLFGLGMFGLVGWSVAIPTLLGIALGIYLDVRIESKISFTLTFLFIGLTIGCLNAWFWIKKEGRHD